MDSSDDDEIGYPLSPQKFRIWIDEKVKTVSKTLTRQNLSERESDFLRGRIKELEDVLEAFNNKKK